MSVRGTILFKGVEHDCSAGHEGWTYARVAGIRPENAQELLGAGLGGKKMYARLAENRWSGEPSVVVEVAVLRSCVRKQMGVLTGDAVSEYFVYLENLARWEVEEAVHSQGLPLKAVVPDPTIPKVYHFDSRMREIGLSFSELFRKGLAMCNLDGARITDKMVIFDPGKLKIETRETHFLATFIWVYGKNGHPVMMIHDLTGHPEGERREHHAHFAPEMKPAVQIIEARLAEIERERAGSMSTLNLLVGSLVESITGQEPND